MKLEVLGSSFAPLGATFDGEGVNFALFSEHASRVDLCLFDAEGNETRLTMPERTSHVFHGYARGLGPGQRYGYRVYGPYEPKLGHRFNPHKLLVDPYARMLAGPVDYAPGDHTGAPFSYPRAAMDDLRMDTADSAPAVPKGVVTHDDFDWGHVRPPRVPWTDTVVYEVHVKGMTKRMPGVPKELAGTYLGLSSDACISHLKALGITTLELLPVHECATEPDVASRGLPNYWGYSTLGFFAPDQRFASKPGAQITEFKQMVKTLHAAGIEVVLDVVYNHTCEGGRLGPTLSLRGIDNMVYYRTEPKTPREYIDTTGCGNALNVAHPQTLKLIMDSLRYWVTEMHVDGFRFDLASSLARDVHHVDKLGSFFDIIHQDPVLSAVKLIAEPWDLGDGGYQVGNFPLLWSEWNGKYRDCVRRFALGDRSRVPEMGFRLTGSSDLYEHSGRRPHASINFITAHDGFSLRDLVSYDKKHNESNLEQNRDGSNDNDSYNFGVEGDTRDPKILALRARQQRNLLATLLLSQGVPMLTAGDELGLTHRGNNNVYCQDNELSWMDYELDAERKDLLAFAQQLIAFRRDHPIFRRPTFLRGEAPKGKRRKDVSWFRHDGTLMAEADWKSPRAAALGLVLYGGDLGFHDAQGDNATDNTFYLLLSFERTALPCALPLLRFGGPWRVILDTADVGFDGVTMLEAGDKITRPANSVLLLQEAGRPTDPPPSRVEV
jgi:isoamylase